MARDGAEPTSAMGVDTPLAVLSEKHQPLFSYFKQLFAQVTNPPMDAIREEIVTATTVYVGSGGNLLEERAENCTVLQIHNPILTVRGSDEDPLHGPARLPCGDHLPAVLQGLSAWPRPWTGCSSTWTGPTENGTNILILSDRGVDENHVAIPSLLAVSAVEQYLVRTKKRTAVAMILESAEPRDVHHFATLLGYGASGHQPLSGAGVRRGAGDAGAAGQGSHCGRQRLQQRHPPRHREDRLQNGHLHHPVLPGRPDLRVPGHQPGRGGQVLHQHSQPGGAASAWHEIRGGRGVRTTARPSIPWAWATTPRWTPPASTSCGPARTRRSTCTTRRPSSCCRQASWTGNYETFKEYSAPGQRAGDAPYSAGRCWTSSSPRAAIPWTRWRVWTSIVKRFKTGCHELRLVLRGGPRVHGHRHEPHGRQVQHRRGRRGRGRALRDRAQLRHQAGSLRPVRRDQQVSGLRPGNPDQDGPGCQARRGRPAARRKRSTPGLPRPATPPPAWPDLSAAAPRHLLHRGPGPADL